MLFKPRPRRLIAFSVFSVFALLGALNLTQPAQAGGLPHPASAAVQETPASAAQRRNETPLRFDPPAAGPRRPTRAEYENCIEHPSLDGLATDCSALLPDTPAAPVLPAKPIKR